MALDQVARCTKWNKIHAAYNLRNYVLLGKALHHLKVKHVEMKRVQEKLERIKIKCYSPGSIYFFIDFYKQSCLYPKIAYSSCSIKFLKTNFQTIKTKIGIAVSTGSIREKAFWTTH
jgi:hypothetical protein